MALPASSTSRQDVELKWRVFSALIMASWGGISAWMGGIYFAATWGLVAVLVGMEWGMMVRRAPGSHKLWYSLGAVYALSLAVSACLLRFSDDQGFAAILFLFAVVWSADVCAFFVGRTFGGPKLAPQISPKKTWSGLIGGLIGAVLVSLLLLTALGYALSLAHIWLAASLALISAGGDLLESHLKRRFGVKDSSHLIPGHGGFMDRLDGFIAVIVVAALIGVVRGGLEGAGSGLLNWS